MSINDVLEGKIRWHLAQADCIDVLRRMPDGCVDAVVTDPPYGISYRSSVARYKPIANDDRPFIWWLREAFRVTKEPGALLCFCRWDVQEAFKFAIDLAGWNIRSQIVWDRLRHGVGDTKATFAPRHDVVWFGTRGRFAFPSGRPASVLPFARVPWQRSVHPTEKPVALLRRLVRAITPLGGLVADPFAGSGSTGVAAIVEGFRFLGVELDPAYVPDARRRLARAVREPR